MFCSEIRCRRPRKAIRETREWRRMPSTGIDNELGCHWDRDNVKRRSGFDRQTLKGFVPSEQTALKQSDNEQGLPWTTLKPWAFAGWLQNGLAGFKMVWTASKPSDGFKVVQVSNLSVTHTLRYYGYLVLTLWKEVEQCTHRSFSSVLVHDS